ncbi:unnamed protein product, partial [Hapterophycus canaliculatus]
MDTVDGDAEEGSGDAALATVIVDHNPAACRLCPPRKPPGGGGVGGGGAGTDMVTGMLFPPASPLWARLGAADASAHGQAALAVDSGGGSGSSNKEGGGGSSPFFPSRSPGTEKTSSSSHSSVSAKSGGDVGGDGSGHSSGAPSAPVAAGSNLFKSGAMFGGMKMNMGGIFNKGAASNPGEGAADADAEKAEGVSSTDAAGPAEAGKGDTTVDLAAKLRLSFGRFGGSKDAKKASGKEGESGAAAVAAAKVVEAAAARSAEKEKDSAFGSLFRKAQSFKAVDVAAAFADLRDGPKSFGASASPSTSTAGLTTAAGGAAGGAGAQQVVEIEEVTEEDGYDDDDDDDAGELFVIGDDGSEASETTDSDFEGFDGEHRPPSSGGVRSAADKEVALLEHRLSGQIKGATMVVDDFLKVPGAKVFNVTKHKVTFHDVDSSPSSATPASTERKPDTETDNATAEADKEEVTKDEGVEGETEADGTGNDTGAAAGETGDEAEEASAPQQQQEEETEVKRVRVRAVTELDRVVFLSRERILVLACPSGPTSPGLVKSNHHLTELQKMTFMRRDPALVTLHYLAPEGSREEEEEGGGGDGTSVSPPTDAAGPATKRNVSRFDLDDKEAFIRII